MAERLSLEERIAQRRRRGSTFQVESDTARRKRIARQYARMVESGELQAPTGGVSNNILSSPIVQQLLSPQEQTGVEPQTKPTGGGGLLGGLGQIAKAGLNVATQVTSPATRPLLKVAGPALAPLGAAYNKVEEEGVKPLAGRLGEVSEGVAGILGAGAAGVTHPLPTQWPANFQRMGTALQRAGAKTARAGTMTTEEAKKEYAGQGAVEKFGTEMAANPLSYIGWGLLKNAGIRAAEKPGVLAAITRAIGGAEAKGMEVADWPLKKVGGGLAKTWRAAPKPTEYKVTELADAAFDNVRVLADRHGAAYGVDTMTGDSSLTHHLLVAGRNDPEYGSISAILGDMADGDPENWVPMMQNIASKNPLDFANWVGRTTAARGRKAIDAAVRERRTSYIRNFGVDLMEKAGKAPTEEALAKMGRPKIGELFGLGKEVVQQRGALGVKDALFTNQAQRALRGYILDGFDRTYIAGYRKTLEPYFVRPMSNAILAFTGFPVFNVLEGAYRQVAGESSIGGGGNEVLGQMLRGFHGPELGRMVQSGQTVGGAMGLADVKGPNWLKSAYKYMGGYFVDVSRRTDAAQRTHYAIQRIRTRLAENLRTSGLQDDAVMREVLDIANKQLPTELEHVRKAVNVHVATAMANGPEAIRGLTTMVNRREFNRRGAMALMEKYSDLSPSVLKVYGDAVRVGGLGRRFEGIFSKMDDVQRVVDTSTPEAIAVRIDDIIDHLPNMRMKNVDNILAALKDVDNLENSTAAYEREITDAFQDLLEQHGFHAPVMEKAREEWRSNIDRARTTIEDGIDRILKRVDQVSRAQGGKGMNALAQKHAKLLSELRLNRHREAIGYADQFWAFQRKNVARVDPEDVYEMRGALQAINEKAHEAILKADRDFHQALFYAERRTVAPTVKAERAYQKEAMRFKTEPLTRSEPAAPETVQRMRFDETGQVVQEDTFASETELGGTRAQQAGLFEKGNPEEIEAIAAQRGRETEKAVARVEAAKRPPTVEELKSQRESVKSEIYRLKQELYDVQNFVDRDNPAWRYANTRTVYRPRYGAKTQALRMGKPQMVPVTQVEVRDPNLVAQLRARGVQIEEQKPRALVSGKGITKRKLGTPLEEQARLAQLEESLPTLKGKKKLEALYDLQAAVDMKDMEGTMRWDALQAQIDEVSAALGKPADPTGRGIARSAPTETRYWADFEDEMWGADEWITEAFGERAGQGRYTQDNAYELWQESTTGKKQEAALEGELKAAQRRHDQLEKTIGLGEEAYGAPDPTDAIGQAELALRGQEAEVDGLYAQLERARAEGRPPLDSQQLEDQLAERLTAIYEAQAQLAKVRSLELGVAPERAAALETPIGTPLSVRADTAAADAKDAVLELQRNRSARLAEFKRDAMKTLREPVLNEDQEAALNAYLERIAGTLEKLPTDKRQVYAKAYQDAITGATDDMKKAFVNYDDRNVIDYTMQHFFPYWVYESRRWPYLAGQVATKPATAKVVLPMVGNPEAGQFRVPGTGYEVGLGRGMVFGNVRRWPIPGTAAMNYMFFPPREGGALGAVQKGEDALASLGFFFGPQVSFPMGIMKGELGEALPAPASTVLDVATAVGAPGAAAMQQRFFKDPWLERDMNQILLNKGLIPSEIRTKADQRDQDAISQLSEARREASLRRAITQQASVIRFRPENLEKIRAARGKAATELGVPEDTVNNRLTMRQNPLTAVDDKGHYILTNEQRASAYERAAEIAGVDVEEVTALSEISEPLRDDQTQEMTRERHLYQIENEKIKDWYAEQMGKVAEQFKPGVSGSQVRDAITRIRDQRRGMRERLNDPEGQFSLYVAGFDKPEAMTAENRNSILYNFYMQAISDPGLTDELGRYDQEAKDSIDAAFRTRYGDETWDGIQARLHKDEHPLERELRLDQDKISDYWGLEEDLWARMTANEPSLQGVSLRQYTTQVQLEATQMGIDPSEDSRWQFIDDVTATLSEVRSIYRKRHPDINVILIKWGYVSTAKSKEAQALFEQQYGYAPRLAQ